MIAKQTAFEIQAIMDRIDPTIIIHVDIDDYEPRIVAFDITVEPNHFQEWTLDTRNKQFAVGEIDQFGNFRFTEATAKAVAEYWERRRKQ